MSAIPRHSFRINRSAALRGSTSAEACHCRSRCISVASAGCSSSATRSIGSSARTSTSTGMDCASILGASVDTFWSTPSGAVRRAHPHPSRTHLRRPRPPQCGRCQRLSALCPHALSPQAAENTFNSYYRTVAGGETWANFLARTNQTATIQLLLTQLERHEDGRIATDDEHLRSQVDQCRPDVFAYVSCSRYGSLSSALPIASSESRPRYPVRADPCLTA